MNHVRFVLQLGILFAISHKRLLNRSAELILAGSAAPDPDHVPHAEQALAHPFVRHVSSTRDFARAESRALPVYHDYLISLVFLMFSPPYVYRISSAAVR